MLDTIKLNDKNKLVQVAKYISKYSGIGTATNIFDAKFELFIKKLQKENNLEDTGIIDRNTWTIMTKALPTCSTSKNKNSIYTCAIQILLGGLTVDGIYGNKTKKAVAAYQAAAELEVDGICGPKTWNSLILKEEKKDKEQGTKILNKCVKYLQWDSKWKKVKYSTYTSAQTIGNSGCGPTSMAMILATWEDSKITPIQTCQEAVKNGYRTKDSGTDWGYFKYVFKHYNCFSKYIETNNVSTLMAALREGALAVCSMNSNDNNFFTKGGHLVVAVGCDNDYIYYNDPNKSETPRKHLASKSQKCLKQAFIFWPFKEVESTSTENGDIINSTNEKNLTQFDVNLEGKIIDISKWQGKIDFKKLKPEVGLVIARASYRTEKDSKFDEYAKAMIENRIPFGVYCYSYAEDTEGAKQEAKALISYAVKYNPLFYIMDAEESKTTTDIIRAFAQELRAQTTKKIGCYVAHHRYKAYKYDTLKNLFDITWIPCYGSNDGTIEGSRKPSYDCNLWQYTSSGKIAGISGRVDLNILMNEEHDLKWFLDIKEE